jgi:hypothetical protein
MSCTGKTNRQQENNLRNTLISLFTHKRRGPAFDLRQIQLSNKGNYASKKMLGTTTTCKIIAALSFPVT